MCTCRSARLGSESEHTFASKEHPGNARVAKVAEGAEACVLHVRGRKTGGERIRSADVRTLRGGDRFSSPRSSDPWDCRRGSRVKRAPQKRESCQSSRGGGNVRCARAGAQDWGAHPNTDLRTLRGKDRFSSARSTDPWGSRGDPRESHRTRFRTGEELGDVELGTGGLGWQVRFPPGPPGCKENPPPMYRLGKNCVSVSQRKSLVSNAADHVVLRPRKHAGGRICQPTSL